MILSATKEASSATMRKALSGEAFNLLKRMILQGHLKPGERLRDRDLAKVLKMSRTPVRDALSRLEQEGFVEVPTEGKGHRVSDPSPKHVADLYELRELLEAYSVRLAAERAARADLDELGEILVTLVKYRGDRAKRGEEIWVGLRIHEVIARASGNTALHETLVRLLDRMRFVVWVEMTYEESESAERTRNEHKALVAAIKEGRADDAETIIRKHIRTARKNILRVLDAREDFYKQFGGDVALVERTP